MRYTDTKRIVDQSLEFPVTHATVVEEIGTVEVTSPDGDSVTVQEILDPIGEESYLTSDALYTAIVGNLDETFIGRKYYDDRGSTFETGIEDEANVSF